jgi:hypothetical protein
MDWTASLLRILIRWADFDPQRLSQSPRFDFMPTSAGESKMCVSITGGPTASFPESSACESGTARSK